MQRRKECTLNDSAFRVENQEKAIERIKTYNFRLCSQPISFICGNKWCSAIFYPLHVGAITSPRISVQENSKLNPNKKKKLFRELNPLKPKSGKIVWTGDATKLQDATKHNQLKRNNKLRWGQQNGENVLNERTNDNKKTAKLCPFTECCLSSIAQTTTTANKKKFYEFAWIARNKKIIWNPKLQCKRAKQHGKAFLVGFMCRLSRAQNNRSRWTHELYCLCPAETSGM